jgi:hypothetical protein
MFALFVISSVERHQLRRIKTAGTTTTTPPPPKSGDSTPPPSGPSSSQAEKAKKMGEEGPMAPDFWVCCQ